jgi:thiamine pyrophosphate-dependent acetolactate synthase large subunit-like protein
MILCCHEEIAVAVAHGYAKATGKIMPAIVHNVVGLQHASMAIYNAWCDHTPVMVMGGTGPMNSAKRPSLDRLDPHRARCRAIWCVTSSSGTTAGGHRGVSVFDHARLSHRHERSGRACLSLFRRDRSGGRDRKRNSPARSEAFPPAAPLQADYDAIKEAAQLLAAAQNPVILADYVGRNNDAVMSLVALADLLSIPGHRSRRAFEFPQHSRRSISPAETASDSPTPT